MTSLRTQRQLEVRGSRLQITNPIIDTISIIGPLIATETDHTFPTPFNKPVLFSIYFAVLN